MNKGETSRITIAIPKTEHTKLKALSVILGKSIKEVILESIRERLRKAVISNKKTLETIKNIEAQKGLVEIESPEDLFEKLGI